MDRTATENYATRLELRAAARRERATPQGFRSGDYLTGHGLRERDLTGAVAACLVIFGIAAIGVLAFGTVHPILAAVFAPVLH